MDRKGLKLNSLAHGALVEFFKSLLLFPTLMSSHSESFSVLRLIHTWCVWRYSIQQTVALPKRDRIIPISVLTKSTAESADCCSECEWVFSCEETLGHLVSFTYDLHPFIFNVKSATSRGCLVERDLVATVWKGLSCWRGDLANWCDNSLHK